MSFLVHFGLVTKDWYEITAEKILIKGKMLPIHFFHLHVLTKLPALVSRNFHS